MTHSRTSQASSVHVDAVVIRDFSRREWLNKDGHPSTGSVVAYHGESPWGKDEKPETLTMLEIADCHCKVRLHRGDRDTLAEFTEKIEKLRNVLDEFIDHLRSV